MSNLSLRQALCVGVCVLFAHCVLMDLMGRAVDFFLSL